MKQKVQTGILLGMIFLSANSFGQATKTYLDLMVNVVSTSINYGESNSIMADYKKTSNGIQAGASFQAGITPGFSLVTELYFMRKGGQLKLNNPIFPDGSTLRLNTIEVPVMARFHFGKFFVNAGPSIAYAFSGNIEISDKTTRLRFNNTIGSIKRFDAGIQVGGGYEFPWKQRRIALDLRYCYGLTNISYDKEMYNRAVMVSVHISKPWKRNPLGKN
jgi:Outer membrane protein beta-barrel domain